MKNIINVKWTGNMSFEANVDGYKIELDADPEYGGKNKGTKPKPLMLVALAGCTAMDVVSILKKMKTEIEFFNVRVEGEMTEEHPKQYYTMKIIYEFKGKNFSIRELENAINLSQEKYCGVSAFYKKVIDIPFEIKIIE